MTTCNQRRSSGLSHAIATPERYRWPSRLPRNLTVWLICLCRRAQLTNVVPHAQMVRGSVDPCSVACPPTRPAGHILGISMRTVEKGQQENTRHSRPEAFTSLHLTQPLIGTFSKGQGKPRCSILLAEVSALAT